MAIDKLICVCLREREREREEEEEEEEKEDKRRVYGHRYVQRTVTNLAKDTPWLDKTPNKHLWKTIF